MLHSNAQYKWKNPQISAIFLKHDRCQKYQENEEKYRRQGLCRYKDTARYLSGLIRLRGIASVPVYTFFIFLSFTPFIREVVQSIHLNLYKTVSLGKYTDSASWVIRGLLLEKKSVNVSLLKICVSASEMLFGVFCVFMPMKHIRRCYSRKGFISKKWNLPRNIKVNSNFKQTVC